MRVGMFEKVSVCGAKKIWAGTGWAASGATAGAICQPPAVGAVGGKVFLHRTEGILLF